MAKKTKPACDIFLEPRKAMTAILKSNKSNAQHWLYFLLGLFVSATWGLRGSFAGAPLFSTVLCLIVSWPIGYVLSALVAWSLSVTGRMLNGKGSFHQLRKAYLWGMIPSYWSLIASIVFFILLALVGKAVISPGAGMIPMYILILPVWFLTFWSIFTTADTIAVVQKYNSTTKAWLNHVLSSIMIGIMVGIVCIVIGAISYVVSPESFKQTTASILGTGCCH